MRVRVSYTATFDKDALKALEAAWGERPTRERLRGIMQDLGETGIDEIAQEGYTILEGRAMRAAGDFDPPGVTGRRSGS